MCVERDGMDEWTAGMDGWGVWMDGGRPRRPAPLAGPTVQTNDETLEEAHPHPCKTTTDH